MNVSKTWKLAITFGNRSILVEVKATNEGLLIEDSLLTWNDIFKYAPLITYPELKDEFSSLTSLIIDQLKKEGI